MKKIFSLILIIITVISLCSCDGEQSDSNRADKVISRTEDSAMTSRLKDKMQATDNCVAVIRLQINPVFDIYLDKNNNVISAEAVNSDAQQVLAHTDITGCNCVDAICELINVVIVTGIVKDDISVIVIPASNGDNLQTEDMIKDIPEAVSGVYHNFNVTAVISDKMAEVQFTDTDSTSKTTNDETANPDTETIKDENGNIIQSEQMDDAGNVIICFYDETGRLTKETSDRADGAFEETIYNENGLPARTTIDFADGSYEQLIFDENGRLIKHIKEKADGTTTETTLDGNGKPLYQTGITGDGGVLENIYHPNGEVKTATITYSDGAYNRQIFDEKGIKLFYEGAYVKVDGVLTNFRFRYDASGRETEYWGQDNFGRPVHRINNPDGTSVTYRTEDDGSVTIINN